MFPQRVQQTGCNMINFYDMVIANKISINQEDLRCKMYEEIVMLYFHLICLILSSSPFPNNDIIH